MSAADLLPAAVVAADTTSTNSSLVITRELSEDEWVELGEALVRRHSRCQWQIGDWARYGAVRYGDKYERLIVATGLTYGTVANMKSVAIAFAECSRRREDLSWSHHQAVASRPPAEADLWLELASKQELSVEQLRVELAQVGRKPSPARAPRLTWLSRWRFEEERVARWRQAAECRGCAGLREWAGVAMDRLASEDLADVTGAVGGPLL